MSEIQFLIGLLKSEEMSKELRDKILDRIAEIDSVKTATPFVPSWPGLGDIVIGPGTIKYGQPIHFQDLCDHSYPQIWHGIIPPPCNKCGKQMPNPFVVTSTTIATL